MCGGISPGSAEIAVSTKKSNFIVMKVFIEPSDNLF